MMVVPWLQQGLGKVVEISLLTFRNDRQITRRDYGSKTHPKTTSGEGVESGYEEKALGHGFLAACLALELGVCCC
jgi:hypothetical protein